MLVPAETLARAIDQAYEQRSGQAQEFIETLVNDDVLRQVQQLAARDDLLDNSAARACHQARQPDPLRGRQVRRVGRARQPYEDR
jgi:hypothetical protein